MVTWQQVSHTIGCRNAFKESFRRKDDNAWVTIQKYYQKKIFFFLKESENPEKSLYTRIFILLRHFCKWKQTVNSCYKNIEGFNYTYDYQKSTSEIKSTYWYSDAMQYTNLRWHVLKNPKDQKIYLSVLKQVVDDNQNPDRKSVV